MTAEVQNEQPSTSRERAIARWLDAAREKGQPDLFAGNRNWTRYAWGQELEVTVDTGDGSDMWTAAMHNVSGGGFGFWSKRQLDVGAVIQVRDTTAGEQEDRVTAEVRHCTVGVRGYLIGAAFVQPLSNDTVSSTEESGARDASVPDGVDIRPPTILRALRTKAIFTCAMLCALAATLAYMVGSQMEVVQWITSPYLVAAGALAIGMLTGWLLVHSEIRFLRFLRAAIMDLARDGDHVPQPPPAPSKELASIREAFVTLSHRWLQRRQEERLQRQRLEEVTRIKSNILAIVSHDLRTPLTSILLYAQMLTEELDTLANEDKQKFLGIISSECSRLSRLLDDLLEVQRLESGRAHWDMRAADLSSVIRKNVGVFEALARSKSIALTVNCPDSLPPVEADTDKISQVLGNLLSNALKYTPVNGKVGVTAEARGSEIVLRVADNGAGIPREQWDHIFDRFSQLSDPNVSQIQGFGLGLNIVKKIVEAHGGAVWCDSEVGRGSEFYISLPITVATDPDVDKSVTMAGRQVLVCDADPELAATIAQTLRHENYDARVVHSGCRLLSLLGQGDVDVVITDVLLPDINATDLLDALKRTKDHPFRLIIHSYAGDGRELIQTYGADIFLRRPVSKEELVMAVETAMKKRDTVGLSVMLVESNDVDTVDLQNRLSDAGHVPLLAPSIDRAAALMHDYATDVVLVPSSALGHEWEELGELGPTDREHTRILVLCDGARRKDRALSDTHGVQLVNLRNGLDELLETLLRPEPALTGEYA